MLQLRAIDEGRVWRLLRSKALTLAIITAVAVVAATAWLSTTLSWPTPVGRDGFYYVVQATSLLQKGSLHYTTPSPLVHFLIAAVAALSGDTAEAVKLTSASLLGLVAWLCGLLVYRVTAVGPYAVLAALIVCTCGLTAFFVIEYVANLLGIACYLLFLLGLHADCCRGRRWPAAATFGIVLCMLAHRSAIALAALGIAGQLSLGRCGMRARCLALSFVIVSVGVAFVLLLGGSSWANRELKVLPLPKLVGNAAWPESVVLLVVGLVVLVHRTGLCDLGVARRRLFFAMASGAVAACLNPWARYSGEAVSVVDRLSLHGGVFVALLLPFALMLNRLVAKGARGALLRAGVAIGSLLLCSFERPVLGGSRSFLEERLRLLSCLPAFDEALRETDAVVAEHGNQFLLTGRLGVAAVGDRERLTREPRRVLWLVRLGNPAPPLPAADHARMHLCNEALLLREDALLKWFAALDAEGRRRLLGANPHHVQRFLGG